jgi:hypothetical protein
MLQNEKLRYCICTGYTDAIFGELAIIVKTAKILVQKNVYFH